MTSPRLGVGAVGQIGRADPAASGLVQPRRGTQGSARPQLASCRPTADDLARPKIIRVAPGIWPATVRASATGMMSPSRCSTSVGTVRPPIRSRTSMSPSDSMSAAAMAAFRADNRRRPKWAIEPCILHAQEECLACGRDRQVVCIDEWTCPHRAGCVTPTQPRDDPSHCSRAGGHLSARSGLLRLPRSRPSRGGFTPGG